MNSERSDIELVEWLWLSASRAESHLRSLPVEMLGPAARLLREATVILNVEEGDNPQGLQPLRSVEGHAHSRSDALQLPLMAPVRGSED
jgi:hypothetical protein